MPARSTIDDLQRIPGVGPATAADLRKLGIHRVRDLRRRSPERLYQELSRLQGPQDPCVLYVFRCAVYFATRQQHDPRLLKWWNWKDRGPAAASLLARASR